MKEEKDMLLLENVSLFSKEDISLLFSYNITTLGALLGATKGLTTNIEIFNSMKYGEFYLERIKETAGEEMLNKYIKDDDNEYFTGLIIDDDENN